MNGLHDIDWKELANQLDFSKNIINAIEGNCAGGVRPATCYRNELVNKLCDSEIEQDDAFKRLIKALEELGHRRLAYRFNKVLLLGIPGEKNNNSIHG